MANLILPCCNGSLWLLDDNLLGLTLLPLQLQRLPSLKLDLPRLHQLDLNTNKNKAGNKITMVYSLYTVLLEVFWYANIPTGFILARIV